MNGTEDKQVVRDKVVSELQRQLRETKDQLRRTKDQLRKSEEALKSANQRIAELEKELGKSPTTKLDESYSVAAEESRQQKRAKKKDKILKQKKKKKKKKRKRLSAEKIKKAVRTEPVYPAGVPREQCELSHTRPVMRIEEGKAVWVAYEIYRGPQSQYGKIPGVIGRSEYGIEIVITLAHLIYQVGLSFEKACSTINFFQDLSLRKSQVDALLKQLSNAWKDEFEILCTLLANSMVVHADETSWSINSVWAFLSENARIFFFGVHKDGETLEQILSPESFEGTVISDDAAVYATFNESQKCWAHLLRKAIRMTLLEPSEPEYRQFADRLLEIYREACRIQADQRFSQQGRERKVEELDDQILELCAPVWAEEYPPQANEAADIYRKLNNELMQLMLDQQLFTFVSKSTVEQPNGESVEISGTNNEAERSLRGVSTARKTERTNKTINGARRRTVIESVLGSLRVYLENFTLSQVVEEVQRWWDRGKSCFTELLEELKLPPPSESILDALFPAPDGL